MAVGEEEQANPGSPRLWAVVAAVEALTGWRAAPGAGSDEATAALLEAMRPRERESWNGTRARALRLAASVGEAAGQAGVGREAADGAVLRAASAIAVAAGADDLGAAARSLVAELLRSPGQPEDWSAHVARRAADYIRKNHHRRLTLEDVARHAHLSPTYFCAVFKREWGIGFRRFLQEVRLARARRLLEDPARTVEAVANAVGYEDVHYFTRVFSREMGMPPGAYRRRRQQEAYRAASASGDGV